MAVRAATAADEPAWREMWQAYCDFYEVVISERVTATTWTRILDPTAAVEGLIAVDAGDRQVGFANFFAHPNTWSDRPICYLEDLFVRPQTRGTGAGRALIEHLSALCRERDWPSLYWQTRENNTVARRLYDRLGQRDDFVRYSLKTIHGV